MSTSSISSIGPNTLHSPQIPEFNSVIDDSPQFHQSLKYWTYKSSQMGSATHEIANGLQEYHKTGMLHQVSGNGLGEILNRSSQIFKDDELLEEPFMKFADTLNRIECYRSMLLTQTEMLGVEPLANMATEMEKTKKCRNRAMKLAEAMHISWEKFAALPNTENLHDPQQVDRQAHQVITLKQKYQLLLADYIGNIQDVNSLKKVTLLQKVLEHMFAEFSYFNYCAQILKDLEPYMTELFEKLQKKQREYEQVALLNDSYRREVETKIDVEAQSKRKLFPSGDANTVIANTPTHFFNKVGGFLSSGVKDLKKQYNSTSPSKKGEEPDWEVIDDIEKMEEAEESSQFYTPLKVEESEASANDNEQENKEENPQEDNDKSDAADGLLGNNKVAPANIPTRIEKEGSYLDGASIAKKGYLRIKERGKSKNAFPLLYFLLDKGYGELLSQAQDQKQPSVFAKLHLSNVKPCNPTVTDRNFCFVLRTSNSEYILQASNSEEYEDWIREIQDGIMQALDGCEPDRRRTYARGESCKYDDDSAKVVGNVVERIKSVEGNTFCADCDCPQPGWASTNIGVVICIECSGIHRGLGVQISKIKSLSLDKWEPMYVEFMECHGNTKMNKVLEVNLTVPKITKLSSKSERYNYIVAKYVNKSFCTPDILQIGKDENHFADSTDGDVQGNSKVDNNADILSDEDASGTKADNVGSREELVLSDSTDEDVRDILNNSVTCLVQDCEDGSHTHPPSLS